MSEEKNAFCGTLSEASVIQKDADRSNIVYLSFQEGIKGKIKMEHFRNMPLQEMRLIRQRSSSIRMNQMHTQSRK